MSTHRGRGAALFTLLLSGCGAGVAATVAEPAAVAEVEQAAPAAPAKPVACHNAFEAEPSRWPHPKVDHPSGVAAADMDGDGLQDVLLAAGNDVGEGPVTLLFNPQSNKGTWQSSGHHHYFRVEAGDINHDDLLDVVATIYPESALGGPEPTPTEVAHVFLSAQGSLPTEPSLRIIADGNVIGSDAAFGDVNGDGWLDLAIATMDQPTRVRSRTKVFLNRQGQLDLDNPWVPDSTSEVPSATAVRFDDIDDDGALDLITSSWVTSNDPYWATVFPGELDEQGRPSLSTKGTRRSWPTMGVVAANFDLAPSPDGMQAVSVFSNRFCKPTKCAAPIARFGADLRPTGWTAAGSEQWSAGRFVHLDGDGHLDLIGAYWKPENLTPAGPVLAFCGSGSGWPTTGNVLARGAQFAAFDVALADLDNKGLVRRTFNWSGTGKEAVPRVTLTLPDRLVERIVSVTKNGQVVPKRAYTTAPGNFWISFVVPLGNNDQVSVEYLTTTSPDLVVADMASSDALPVLLHR